MTYSKILKSFFNAYYDFCIKNPYKPTKVFFPIDWWDIVAEYNKPFLRKISNTMLESPRNQFHGLNVYQVVDSNFIQAC